ncbi:MAG: DUF308 domain-containing protein [Methyloceanibacter sp.]|jgi:uncharacterized membrane protein HdeD (DUF308 family)|uniref:HdeD family acid-resistance protein n=2 Tax=Methyloceanibacter sp. TaxID=1965321 RepID=UPI003C45F3A7
MSVTTVPKSHSDIWWVFLLEGIASIIFGFLLITRPAETLVALVVFLGLYWLFVGVLELVRVFVDDTVPWYWSLIIGVLGILAGIIVLKHPVFSAVVLPTAIVVWLGVLGVVIGIIAIIGAFTGGGFGSFIFGLINLIIGVVLLGAPIPAAVALPIVFGALLLIQGVILIVYAFKARE